VGVDATHHNTAEDNLTGDNVTGDNTVFTRHAGHRCTSSARTGTGQRVAAGRYGQDSDGCLCTGSYQVTPPGRTRAQATPPTAESTDPGQDSNSASVDGGSDPTTSGAAYILHLTVDGVTERQHIDSRILEMVLAHDRSSTADRDMRGVTTHGSSWNPQCETEH
jgi:hypothetical protein